MPLSLESLEVLDAIDRNGSFAAAAQELQRVPSAITYVVRKLEEELDVLLFDRRKHRAELTIPGRTLLDEGRHLLRAADALTCRVKRLATGWEAELTIACDSLLNFQALLPVIADFDAENPGTRLRFIREVLGGTWDALLHGRADMALGAPYDRPASQGIATRLLTDVPFVFAVAPHHPLAAVAEPLSAKEIAQYRIVAAGDTSRNQPVCSKGILGGQDILTVPDMLDKIEAQRRGLGCGWLPEPMIAPLVASGALIVKRTQEEREPAALHLAWRTSPPGKALKWWLKRLEEPRLVAALMPQARWHER